MGKVSRSIFMGLVAVPLTVLGLAAPATADGSGAEAVATNDSSAAQITVHHNSDGSEWGVAKITMDAKPGDVSTMSENCVNPSSGGTWCFGWYSKWIPSEGVYWKHCYSNYYHGSKRHYSNVKIAGAYSGRDYADAGSTANASRDAGYAYTCETYYGIA